MLLFADTPSYYTAANTTRKWTEKNSTNCTWTIESTGRQSRACFRRTHSSATATGYLAYAPLFCRTGLWTPASGGVYGQAFKVSATNLFTAGAYHYSMPLFAVYNGSDPQLVIEARTDGTLSAWRINSAASETQLGSVTAQAFADNVWIYLEVEWLLHASTGYFNIWLNGVSELLAFTGDTEGGYGTTWTSIRTLKQGMTGGSLYGQDAYLLDDAQPDAKDRVDRFGDIFVESDYPDADGYYQEATPNSGPNHYDRVNNDDDDTTYNSLTASGQRDTFTFPTTTTDPLAVIYVTLPRKDEDGSAGIACLERWTGASPDEDVTSTTQGIPATTYSQYLLQPKDFHEASDAAWTAALANETEAGYAKA